MNKQANFIDFIADKAVDALIAEAQLAPKPGLVDSNNNGSHKDMDVDMFIRSAHAFKESFKSYVCVGANHTGTPKKLMAKIRPIGMIAEKKMFEETKNINTHKGANFSFGVVLSAIGYITKNTYNTTLNLQMLSTLILYIKEMTDQLIEKDFEHLSQKTTYTFGEKLYLEHGIAGIRAEAQNGFPSIFELVLPTMLEMKRTEIPSNQIYLEALITFMSVVDDSNIIKRGGINELAKTKDTARQFLQNGGTKQTNYLEQLQALDFIFIEKNISPGGSADLLALAIFIASLCE